MTLILAIALISLPPAFAGRESHGLMPSTGFECQPSSGTSSDYTASLLLEKERVITGELKSQGKKLATLPCLDGGATRKSGENKSTVYCARPLEWEYMLELEESDSAAQLKIWKVELNQKLSLLETLSCQ